MRNTKFNYIIFSHDVIFSFFSFFIKQVNRNLMDVQWPDFKLDILDTVKGGG